MQFSTKLATSADVEIFSSRGEKYQTLTIDIFFKASRLNPHENYPRGGELTKLLSCAAGLEHGYVYFIHIPL
jgi:hypothetical protein